MQRLVTALAAVLTVAAGLLCASDSGAAKKSKPVIDNEGYAYTSSQILGSGKKQPSTPGTRGKKTK